MPRIATQRARAQHRDESDRARRARRMRELVRVCALLLAGACSEPVHEESAVLDELEALAFIPPGDCTLLAFGPPVVCRNVEPLLVDRYEVTRERWQRWYEQATPKDPLLTDALRDWRTDTAQWPATFMTLDEARAYAASRGMRLLSGSEWMRVASGARRSPWPWGQNRASSVANTLDLELGRPVAVGTFEQGRTPLTTYDMIGNVWEWVEAPILPAELGPEFGLACAMGGSYLSRQERLYQLDGKGRLSFCQQDLDARSRCSDVGLRCAVEAEPYLWERLHTLSATSRTRERLRAIGSGWGHDAIPLLEELSARAHAPASLHALLEGARG